MFVNKKQLNAKDVERGGPSTDDPVASGRRSFAFTAAFLSVAGVILIIIIMCNAFRFTQYIIIIHNIIHT